MLTRLRRGKRYDGHVAFCSDYSLVDRPGFYALSKDGKQLRSRVRLVCVDDAPGDEENGAHHFEYAGKRDPIARNGSIVALEAHPEGVAEVSSE